MMKKAAVLGHPITHSLSPLIHNYWIAQYGIDAKYEAIDAAPEALGETVRRLADEGYAGFNLTLPHKTAVMEYCDTLDETARTIGAVNTVVIQGGKLHGGNTDAFGFISNLQDQCPAWQGYQRPALVLGAGGAAKAVLHALQNENVPEIFLANRTEDTAWHLASGNPHITVIPWEHRQRAAKDATLIVNTTSLGMTGQKALEMDLSTTRATVYDIVYRPLLTPLLIQAKQNGLPVVTGLGMLLHQARPAFERWFGVLPAVDDALIALATQAARAS